mgnify:CR=1 FL=1
MQWICRKIGLNSREGGGLLFTNGGLLFQIRNKLPKSCLKTAFTLTFTNKMEYLI